MSFCLLDLDNDQLPADMVPANNREDLIDALRQYPSIRIYGMAHKNCFRLPSSQQAQPVRFVSSGIVEFMPNDQVAIVRAGTDLYELNKTLYEEGQTIPIPMPRDFERDDVAPCLSGYPGTVGGAIATNLPHALDGLAGSWRDWVLGMTLVMADGTVVKTGSRAVKNVAGYDLHKLMIGSRGTLGIITEVILRTSPLKAKPQMQLRRSGAWNGNSDWIQRVWRSDYQLAIGQLSDNLIAADDASGTLYATAEPGQDLPRFEGDWLFRSRCGAKNLQITDPTMIRYMKRAKELFDPTHKLNPGEMGIF